MNKLKCVQDLKQIDELANMTYGKSTAACH